MKKIKSRLWKNQPFLVDLLVGVLLVVILLAGSRLDFEQPNILSTTKNLQTSFLLSKVNFQTQLKQLSQQSVLTKADSLREAQAESLLSQMRVQQQLLQSENDRLREALNLTKVATDVDRRVSAPILSVPQRLIELPQTIAPELGQVVMGEESLLGWISAVQGQRAKVDLLSDTSSLRLVATTSSGFSGVVTSQRGNIYLTEVPTEFPLQVGDVVLTEAQLIAPAGLVLGKIQSISTDNSGSLQTGLILPTEYFGEMPLVWIARDLK